MRLSPLQIAIMAAIVATLLWLPLVALLSLAAHLAFGISWHELLTFGEVIAAPEGLVAWWVIALVPAGVYAAIVSR